MPELESADRTKLKDSQFAYIDELGERHLPIPDESHVRNAVSRFNQTDFESGEARKRAARRIIGAARKHGVDIAADDDVRKAAKR
jgi:hypothetical protein